MEDSEIRLESEQKSEIEHPSVDEVLSSSIINHTGIILPPLQITPPYNESNNDKKAQIYNDEPIHNDPFPLISPNNRPEDMSQNHLYQSVFGTEAVNHLANDRKGFIKKVYALLCIQLTWTVFFIGIVVGIPEMREGIQKTIGLFYAALVITVLLIISLMCFKKIARKYPQNYILMFTFSSFESYILAFISSYYDPYVVLSAVLITFVVTLSLTIYAFKTKTDFTVCGGILVSVTVSLIMFGFLMIFFYQYYANMLFCELAIILYSIFIVYDTQLIAGGRYDEITLDDYVLGALMLYVDIIGLFLYILSLLGSKNS